MIGKLTKGKGFRGVLEYALKKEQGQVLDTNMAGQDAKALAAEFGELRKIRPSLGKAVMHISLSAVPGEHLSNEQWRLVGNQCLTKMGFTDNQFLIVRHEDTEHEHIHIIANRICFDGQVVSDSHEYRRLDTAVREIEKTHNLIQIKSSQESTSKEATRGEIEFFARTGVVSTKQRLQQLCKASVTGCSSYSDYQGRLEAAGIEVIPVAQLNGAKLSGLSYRLDGVLMKGSDLGKGYSPAGLAKQGVTYEQNRDYAAVCRCIEREKIGANDGENRTIANAQDTERGGVGGDIRTISAGDGGTSRRDTESNKLPGVQEQGFGRGIQPEGAIGYGKSNRGFLASSESHREPEDEALRDHDIDGRNYRNARERIMVLSETPDSDSIIAKYRWAFKTYNAVNYEIAKKQLDALGVEQFKFRLVDHKTGKRLESEREKNDLAASMAWFTRMNVRGYDMYVKPVGEHGLVLIGDLKRFNVDQMRGNGFASVIVQKSSESYQAWSKLSKNQIPEHIRSISELKLAKEYGSDIEKSAQNDLEHTQLGYGRLAGFTNQSVIENNGQNPYVLLLESHDLVTERASGFLEQAKTDYENKITEQNKQARIEAIKSIGEGGSGFDPVVEYKKYAKQAFSFGVDINLQSMDLEIAKQMVLSGRFNARQIVKAIMEASPSIRQEKLPEYANEVATRTMDSAEIKQMLLNKRERGQER